MSLLGYTIEKLEEMLHKKHISAEELVQMSIDRIDEVEDEIKAFITLDKEGALEQAKELDEQGIPKDAPFAALPIGIKDNLVTKNMRTTAASKFLENFNEPLYDATAVKRLKDAKAINLGKLNMDEFAMGSTTENSSYQITRNPWNTDYAPGGSRDRKSTRLNSSHVAISYAVF